MDVDDEQIDECEVGEEEEEVDEGQFYEEDPNAIYETSYLLTPVHSKDAVSVAISPSTKYVATGGLDDVALLFQTKQSLKVPFMVYPAKETVLELAFDPTESFLAYVAENEVYIVDLKKFMTPRIVELDEQVTLIAWNPLTTGKYDSNDYLIAVVPSMMYAAKLQVTENGVDLIYGFYFTGESPTTIQITADGERVVLADASGQVSVFNTLDGSPLSQFNLKVPISSSAMGFGSTFAFGLSGGKVSLSNFGDNGKLKASGKLGEINDENVPVDAICFSSLPQRRYLAFATLSGSIELHDVQAKNTLRFKYSCGNTSVLKLAFSSTVDKLYAGTYDGSLYVFDVHSDRVLDVYVSRGKINTFAFDIVPKDDGSVMACSVSSKGQLRYFLDPFPQDSSQMES
uniref:WD_REPEATS_REGION domain-containing protein n=1 Tax=Panagrellus redivivus TaxID=6233 RepID=A0A7E4WCK6_PANRE